MDEIELRPIPAGWIEALDRAEADVVAGRTVEAETVHAKLRTGLARIEAQLGLSGRDRRDQARHPT